MLRGPEGLVEGIEVPGDLVGAELVGGVRIGGEPADRFLAPDDLPPPGSPGRKEALHPGQAVQDLRLLAVETDQVGLVRDRQAAEVTDVFAQGQFAVDAVPRRRGGGERVELGYQLRGQRLERGAVVLRPPVAEQTAAVILGALVVEAVSDLVTDDAAGASCQVECD